MKEFFIKAILWFYVFAHNVRKNDCPHKYFMQTIVKKTSLSLVIKDFSEFYRVSPTLKIIVVEFLHQLSGIYQIHNDNSPTATVQYHYISYIRQCHRPQPPK